jgi:hypothetical protein
MEPAPPTGLGRSVRRLAPALAPGDTADGRHAMTLRTVRRVADG